MDHLDWHECHPRRFARWAARALADGACIGFPGLTVRAAADAHLLPTPAVLVAGLGPALDWAPALGDAGRRVARRLWPGPSVLVTREGVARGLASRLPALARHALGDALRLRTPRHDSLAAALALSRLPLACAEGGSPDVVVTDEQFRASPCPTLEADGPSLTIPTGTPGEAELRERLARVIVFVCTGNTCRSPMAEALFKRRLCARLACTPDELSARGWVVVSAGLAAMPGMPAAREAVSVAGPLLDAHRSRPLTDELAARADLLLGMTAGHVAALRGLPARTLCPDGDVADPVGGPLEEYVACAAVIEAALGRLLEEIA